MSDDLRSLFDKARFRSEERGFVFGLVGKHNIDASISYQVAGRQDFLYVTIASKTVIIARNDAGVPQTEDYPVKLRRDSLGIFVIVARATNSTLGAPIAIPPSGVVAHSTSHKHGGTDEVATATPAANAIVKADADGKIGAGWLDAADLAAQMHAATLDTTPLDADEVPGLDSSASFGLVRWTWTSIKAFLKTYFDTLYNLYVHPNHSGDVTSTGDGATVIGASKVLTTMIANDNVTFAKLPNIATDSLIGRDTASSGDPENILLNATLSMDGAGNLRRAALTGDVTASAGSNATTIAADAVTNAKAANMAADTIKGRANGAGTGDPTDLSKAQVLTLLNVADGANAYVHPNHSGDVTSVADGATTIGALKVTTGMVAASAITYAKIQNVSATDKVLGRSTAGAGVIEEIALTAYARTLIDDINAAAARTTLGLGTIATLNAADFVDLTNAQTVAGIKTWSNNAYFSDKMMLGGTAPSHKLQVKDAANAYQVKLQANSVSADAWGGIGWSVSTDDAAGIVTAVRAIRKASSTDIDLDFRGNADSVSLMYLDSSAAAAGFGTQAPTGKVSIQAGTSTGHANAGGVLYVSTATVGNVGTGEDTLASFSVPANTLAVNGQSLWFEAWGTQPNNLNTKMLRARFGSAGTNLFFSKSISEGAIATWFLRGRIYRTGAATQKGHASVFTSNAAEGDSSSALNQTLSGAITFSITGEATANNDIVCEGFIVGWDDNHA